MFVRRNWNYLLSSQVCSQLFNNMWEKLFVVNSSPSNRLATSSPNISSKLFERVAEVMESVLLRIADNNL